MTKLEMMKREFADLSNELKIVLTVEERLEMDIQDLLLEIMVSLDGPFISECNSLDPKDIKEYIKYYESGEVGKSEICKSTLRTLINNLYASDIEKERRREAINIIFKMAKVLGFTLSKY